MSSITTWQRLEPIPRTKDLRLGLRAEIADPLWMLARQRQFGELRGEDAGSPIEATVKVTSGRISRVQTRFGATATAFDHRVDAGPLEAIVEGEPLLGTGVDGALVVSAGLEFLRLLRANQATSVVTDYVTAYGLVDADLPGDDPDAVRLRRRAVGRVPDARRLAADLLSHRGQDPELTSLPGTPQLDPGNEAKALSAANQFLAGWETMFPPAPVAGDAWVANHLEHAFAVQADTPAGKVVLRADEYRGGRLDWSAFTAGTTPNLGDPAETLAPVNLVRTVLPTPVSYGGMPAQRFWEIEDGTVRFGALDTGRTDLARMALAEFALTYGNDWFVVPVDLPVGSVASVDGFTVVDTFGIPTEVGRSVAPGGARGFRMFELDGVGRASNLFFLAPAVAEVSESPPTEHVVFFRDEMANVVWGVERIYQGGTGGPVERFEEHQRRLGEQQELDVDTLDAQLLYRLQTDIPDHWHPFVPVRAAGVAPTDGVIQLERRQLVRVLPDGSSIAIDPKGRVLTAEDPLRLEEEEVPRDGTEVVRTFQLTRWSNGRYTLWSGRKRTTGAGEGRSNFRTDVVVPVTS